MKVAIVLLALVAVASAAPRHAKRGYLSSFSKWVQGLYSDAKKLFESVTSKVDFGAVMDKLVDQIDSSYTQTGCKALCNAGAGALLGAAAGSAGSVCDSMCEVALAELEELAG